MALPAPETPRNPLTGVGQPLPADQVPQGPPRPKARFRPQGGMNGTELAYSQYLEQQRRVKRIQWWAYESVKLRLADGTWFTCDFMVIAADGTVEMHEVKGFMREAARVRLNVAADRFPFVFKLVRLEHQQWEITEI